MSARGALGFVVAIALGLGLVAVTGAQSPVTAITPPPAWCTRLEHVR